MDQQGPPSPELLFESINAYQRTAAIKAAVELDLFTLVGEQGGTAAEIARRCRASERGTRILCDYLTIIGFLVKQDGRYLLTRDSAIFLNRHSPAYVGSVLEFLLLPLQVETFSNLAEIVRNGRTNLPGGGSTEPDHPMWVSFARGMAPLMRMPSQSLAELVPLPASQPVSVLDVAAGHGLFGIAFAQKSTNVQVTAVDWGAVLEVARENAREAGVSDRYKTIAGSAFDVDLGGPYDIILLTNFLHHFDKETNVQLLKRMHAALAPGGRVVTLEFVPNADRVSPPGPASFSLTMLAGTEAGDAYTFDEINEMLTRAGFTDSQLQALPTSFQQVVISKKM